MDDCGQALTTSSPCVRHALPLPPAWVALYMGSIVAAGVAGSTTDTLAGVNIEHILLGGSAALTLMFLLFRGNYRGIAGANVLLMYLSMFVLAIFLGLLSSIHPGPEIVGTGKLIYWCGIVVSVGISALVAICGHTRWVLAAIALAGLPVVASILQPFLPFLSQWIPVERLHPLHDGRATGFFANPNSTGFALYASLAACLCYYHLARRREVKYGCVLFCLLYGGAISMTLSRGSLLVAVLTMAAFLFTLWRRMVHRSLVLAATIVAAAVAAYYLLPLYTEIDVKQSRVLDESLYEGDTFRLQGLLAAMRNPGYLFLGEGTGQFVQVSGLYVDAWDKAPHNQILGIWVEWGFLAVLLLYAAHTWMILHGVKRVRQRSDDAEFMLLAAYFSIVLYLQVHEVNSPASCALLGLYVGAFSESIPARLSCGTDVC